MSVAYNRKRRLARKQFMEKIKLESGCVDCGYKENVLGLDFDHIDESKKKFNISHMVNHSEETILKELENCVVRCCRCHAIRTRSRRYKLPERK